MRTSRDYYYKAVASYSLRWIGTYTFYLLSSLVLLKYGIDAGFVAAAFSFMPLLVLILDIPTGIFADKFSCRTALLWAGFCDSVGFIALLLAQRYPYLAFAAFALKGVSIALDSGAFRVMILAAANVKFNEPEKGRKVAVRDIMYSMRFSSLIATGLSLYLLQFDADYPVLIALAAAILSVILVWQCPRETHGRKHTFDSLGKGLVETGRALRFCVSLTMLPLLLYVLLEGYRMGADQPLFVPWIKLALQGEEWLWIIAPLSFFVRTPITWFVHRVNVSDSKLPVLVPLMFLFVGISFLGMGTFAFPMIAPLFIVINFMLYAFRDYWFESWQLKQIQDNPHLPPATTLSGLSVVQNGMAFFGAQFLAVTGLIQHPDQGYIWIGVVVLMVSSIILILSGLQRSVIKARLGASAEGKQPT